jgi:hypothetical protein
MRPLSEWGLNDNVTEPVPGLPVFGVYSHLSNGHPFYSIVQSDGNNYPYVRCARGVRPGVETLMLPFLASNTQAGVPASTSTLHRHHTALERSSVCRVRGWTPPTHMPLCTCLARL